MNWTNPSLYTPAELLSFARVSIHNAQWLLRGGRADQCALSLESARYFIAQARKQVAA